MNVSKTMKFALAMIGLLVFLTACGSGNNNAQEQNGSQTQTGAPASGQAEQPVALDPVELIWYYPGPDVPADLKTVQDEVNKLTKAKINATIKMMPVGFGDYDQKMNTVVAAGEDVDIMFTSNWILNYVVNQSKGAFIALDELIEEYGADLKSTLPDFVWDATRIDGKIYAVPNYQTVTMKEGFVIQKSLVEKYNLDVTTIRKPEDIEPFLQTIKENEPDMIPFVVNRAGKAEGVLFSRNLESISTLVTINWDDPDRIFNFTESEEYKQNLAMFRKWYVNGWVNKDAGTLKSDMDLTKLGNVAVTYGVVLRPGGEADYKIEFGGKDVVYAPITEPYVGTNTIITTMNAISRTSKNPERAMMFIRLLNTDKELYNLISYGIKGKHYEENADGTIRIITDSGYVPNADWVFGNTFNGLIVEGKSAEILQKTKEENENATPSPIMGFKFMPDAVAAEIANINAVRAEYGPAVNTGVMDYEEKLAEYQAKLKNAGIEKVIAEAQKQLDAWKSTK